MGKRILAFLIFFIFYCSPVSAEVIHLKSGKIVEGKIVEQTDQFIKIDTGIGVPVTFYHDEINFFETKISSEEQPLLQLANNNDLPAVSPSIFLIGQDVRSIDDFMAALKDFPSTKELHTPDGIMAYTAINDVRGLSEPVDHGAGVNYTDELFRKYPKVQIVQIGLYMKYMLKEVVQGGLDENINQLGQWIKSCGKRVYLRVGYEFDNPDNDYDPEQYVKAYRYIVDRIKKLAVPNVYFVWHTIAWKAQDWPAYDPMKWFPGDSYVDWVGISFFDSQRDEERDAAAELARKINKPLMIAESSPFNQYSVEGKLQWIKKLFEYIRVNKASFLSYINVNWDELPLFKAEKWGDARLENNPVLLEEFLKQIEQFRSGH